MGTTISPQVLEDVRALFDAEQQGLAIAPTMRDIAYGPHPRHVMDIYRPDSARNAPVLVFVHGGGFLRGDKGGDSPAQWHNANVGVMAAARGMVGVVINYRLAPDHTWPSGPDDLDAAVDWLVAHVADHGGDPSHIVLMGTSAGAVHVAGWIARAGHTGKVRGAVLLSGLYGYTPLDERDTLYYGKPALYPERMPRDGVANTTLPLFVACAQYDPPRFQAEFVGLMQQRLALHGTMPMATIAAGHNHFSLPMHLGTQDTRLADAIADFVLSI